MNARRPSSRLPKRITRAGLRPSLLAPLLLAAAATTGCEGTLEGGDRGGAGGGVSTRDPQLDALSNSAELLSRIKHILNTYCAECHSGREGRAEGGFDSIFDAVKMAELGIVELGKPELSKLIERVRDDSMPPRDYGFRPTEQDIKLLELWIQEGSPPIIANNDRPKPTREAVLSALQKDLNAQPPGSEADIRYINLASLVASPNIADRELEAYENAVSKLVNSLSTESGIKQPAPVLDDLGRVIAVRVRLSDYGWNASDWGTIEKATELTDRIAAPCDVPFINADALVAVASSDNVPMLDGTTTSVYSNVILKNWLARRGVIADDQSVYPDGQTTTLGWGEIEQGLELNVAQAITSFDGTVIRAGMSQSGESAARRVVERYTTPTGGYYWRSYDFSVYSGSDPLADIFRTPVGPAGQIYNNGAPLDPAVEPQFTPGGGAGFFRLANGLQAYIVVDAAGRMTRSAAADISSDPLNVAGKRANDNGNSCLRCHINGVADVTDQVLGVVSASKSAYSNYALGFVLGLHRPPEELKAVLAADSQSFRDATRSAHVYGSGASGPLPDAISDLSGLYRGYIDLESIAAEFLVDTNAVKNAAGDIAEGVIGGEPDKRAVQLLSPGGGLPRGTLKALYPKLRQALSVGDFGEFCVKKGTATPPPEEPPPEEPPPEEPPPEEPPPEEPPPEPTPGPTP